MAVDRRVKHDSITKYPRIVKVIALAMDEMIIPFRAGFVRCSMLSFHGRCGTAAAGGKNRRKKTYTRHDLCSSIGIAGLATAETKYVEREEDQRTSTMRVGMSIKLAQLYCNPD